MTSRFYKRWNIYLNNLIVADIEHHGIGWSKNIITPYKIDFDKEIIDYYWDTGPTRSASVFTNFKPVLMFDDSFRDELVPDCWDWDKVDLFFLRTYRTIDPGVRVDFDGHYYGWIAPDGTYYSTRYGDHDGMAKLLVAHLENKIVGTGYDAREYLFKEWLCIHSEQYLLGRQDADDITQAQLETVTYISELVEGKQKRSLLRGIRRREVV